MVFISEEMQILGVKLHACWKRWSHYVVQLLVPDDDNTMRRVSEILHTWVPGKEEMLLSSEDSVEWLEHFSDRDFVGHQPVTGMQVVRGKCWYHRPEQQVAT